MLAIVIPYFKPNFFAEMLSSLAGQTDKRFRVYIGDDASKTDPGSMLERYREVIDIHYQRFEDNLGGISLVRQWNRCLALMQDEEWVMVLGDDDVLESNVVEEFYKQIDDIRSGSAVVRFATYKINDQGASISAHYLHPKIEKATDFLFRDTRSSLSEFIFHRKELEAVGFREFPLAWFSDILAVLEVSGFQSVYTINEASVLVRISDSSISGSSVNLQQKFRAAFEFYHYLFTNKKQHFSKQQLRILLQRMSKCYIYNKKQMGMFWEISKLYHKNGTLADYGSFLKSIFRNFFKKFN